MLQYCNVFVWEGGREGGRERGREGEGGRKGRRKEKGREGRREERCKLKAVVRKSKEGAGGAEGKEGRGEQGRGESSGASAGDKMSSMPRVHAKPARCHSAFSFQPRARRKRVTHATRSGAHLGQADERCVCIHV